MVGLYHTKTNCLFVSQRMYGVAVGSCAAIQRDLGRLEKQANRKLMKVSQQRKVPCPAPGKEQLHMLGAEQLERSLAGKGPGGQSSPVKHKTMM